MPINKFAATGSRLATLRTCCAITACALVRATPYAPPASVPRASLLWDDISRSKLVQLAGLKTAEAPYKEGLAHRTLRPSEYSGATTHSIPSAAERAPGEC